MQQVDWWFSQLNPTLQWPLLALLMLLLSRYAPLPAHYQPWLVLRVLAQAVAAKVNAPGNSRQQQLLAGTLSVLVLTMPWLLLAFLVRQLSEWPELLDAVLLYLCLDWQVFRQQALLVQQSLSKQQLQLAREQLAPLVLRKTTKLTAMGISKACIEALLLRQAKHWFGVICWFLLGGGLAALFYRMLLELQQQWNPKLEQFQLFGQTANWLSRVMSIPAQLFNAILLAILVHWRASWRYAKNQSDPAFNWPLRWLIGSWSAALARELAGPVYYSDTKLRRIRIGPALQPQSADIKRCLDYCDKLQHSAQLLLLCALGLIWLATTPFPL